MKRLYTLVESAFRAGLLRGKHRIGGLALLTLLAAAAAFAQSDESMLSPDYVPPKVVETPAIPDVPDATLAAQKIDNKHLTLHWGLAILVDYTGFSQDANSVTQVGTQEDKLEFRDFRFILRGDLKFLSHWNYFAAAAYKGFGQNDGDDDWALNDLNLSHALWSPSSKFTIGKQKEPYVYELVGDSANLPQQERILSPFFVSRGWGAKISDTILDRRATWSLGVFNDWFLDDAQNSGTEVAGRLSYVPVWVNEGKTFLHVAASFRYNEGDDNTLRYRGRPESNVADYYVDTGNLSAGHAWHYGLEALWNEGPFSILAEYVCAEIDSPASGDPTFSGWYVTGSWVLTGETRPYDRNVGFARRVLPTKRWGAWELVGRVSRVDLDDALVHGGTMDKVYVGVNWWATKRWKAGFGWGRTWLERGGVDGRTDAILTRLQWIY